MFELFDELPSDGSDSEFDGYVDDTKALDSGDEVRDTPSPPQKHRRTTRLSEDSNGIESPSGRVGSSPAPPKQTASTHSLSISTRDSSPPLTSTPPAASSIPTQAGTIQQQNQNKFDILLCRNSIYW